MKDTIIEYIQEDLLAGQEDMDISADEELLESGLVDSIGVMRLIGFVEETYDLKVPPQDMTIENFRSVNAICDYLTRLKAEAL